MLYYVCMYMYIVYESVYHKSSTVSRCIVLFHAIPISFGLTRYHESRQAVRSKLPPSLSAEVWHRPS